MISIYVIHQSILQLCIIYLIIFIFFILSLNENIFDLQEMANLFEWMMQHLDFISIVDLFFN